MTAIIDHESALGPAETVIVNGGTPPVPEVGSVAGELSMLFSEAIFAYQNQPKLTTSEASIADQDSVKPKDDPLFEDLVELGLSWLQEEVFDAHGRATPNGDGSGTLTHLEDPSFSFVIGIFPDSKLIKLGTNGVSTLVYEISDGSVFRHVGKGDVLSGRDEISRNPYEVASLASLIQKGA